MPELPEVDLVARTLHQLVASRPIRSAELKRERLAPSTTPAEFAEFLANSKIESVIRRGKHLIFDLDNSKTLIVHLRMSGRFSLLDAEDEDPKFTHAVFHFDGGQRLVFDDQRHFGLMKIVNTGELHTAKELAKLAPEPFGDEFNPAYLRAQMQSSTRSLKEFLLDQTKVTGLGNIYAAEALFVAGINPELRANKLSRPRSILLFNAIVAVLTEAIELSRQGETDPKIIDGRYFSDNAERQWLVYDREGQPCVNCNSPIVRLKQGGRSTYFCRKCQRR